MSFRDRIGKLLFGNSYLSQEELVLLNAVGIHLAANANRLKRAMISVGFTPITHRRGFSFMNPTVQALIDEITKTNGILDSAVVYVTGVQKLITDAVAAAIAGGATAAQLAPLTDLAATLDTKAEALKTAIAANG